MPETARRRLRLLAALGATCALALALLGVRIAYSHRLTYDFLAWNLVLAAIPLGLAVSIDHLLDRSERRASLALMPFWILFLPNAPYIVTDFVHLAPRPEVPLWFDVLLFSAFAWSGLLLGF